MFKSDQSIFLVKDILVDNLKSLILVIFLMVFTAALQSTSILGLVPLIDFVANEEASSQNVLTRTLIGYYNQYNLPVNIISLGFFFLALVILKNSILLFEGFVRNKTIMRIKRDMIYQEYKSFIYASWSFFGTKKYGTLANTVVNETEKATIGFESIAAMAASIISLIFYCTLLFLISWQLTFFVIIFTFFILYPLMFIVNKLVYKIGKNHTAVSNAVLGNIFDTLNSLKLVLGFAKHKDSLETFKPAIDALAKNSVKMIMIRLFIQVFSEPFVIFLVVISIFLGQTYFLLDIAVLVVFIYTTSRFGYETQKILGARNQFIATLPSFEQIGLLKEEADLMKERSDGIKIQRLNKGIYLSNLSFSYSNMVPILSNVSIEIPKGSMVAIVGPSGAGKSSLIDLILGFHNAQSGSLIIDGMPIEEVNLMYWRSIIGYIPQQPFLFNTSVKDNLLWANKHAS